MENGPSLVPPPRAVPLSLRLRTLMGGVLSSVGCALLAFGGFMATLFVGNSEFVTWYRFATELATTEGTVLATDRTNMKHNEQTVFRVAFEYEVNGQFLQGASYARSRIPPPDTPVVVEYAVGDPATARIEGLQSAPFPIWVAFILLFPLAGAILLAIGLRRGRRRAYLLQHGAAAWGLLTDKQRTSTKVNNEPVYKLTFTFVDDRGEQRNTIVRSHRREHFDDNKARLVLFDPASGTDDVLDLMPGPPQIEADRWRPVAIMNVARFFVLPIAAVAAILIARTIEL